MSQRLVFALLAAAVIADAMLPTSAVTPVALAQPATTKAPATMPAVLDPDPPMKCTNCAEWNLPRKPFKVFGNTYFVGSQGLSSLLIVTDQGLVLIDVALPQSAPLIDANIRSLGFRTTDIKYILSSHAHYDHVGGMRSMQRFTKATVLASSETARALALGHPVPEDPQFEADGSANFPAFTAGVRVVKDGEVTRLGSTAITAHYTPGHTPGASTWTWQSCEGSRCLDMVYVDSLTAVANDTFRFTGSNGTPGIVDSFRASIRKVAALPCDVLISTHPSATGMDEKVAKRTKSGLTPGAPGDPFVDANACKALADVSLKGIDARVATETAKK